MKKFDFVEKLASKLAVNKKEAERLWGVFVDVLKTDVKTEGKFRIFNFGTFSVVHREARNSIVPRTGERIVVPAKKVVKFKSSKAFVDFVNSE